MPEIIPGGNSLPNSGMANFWLYKGDTVEVGTYPYRGSPYGAMDMAGNVSEWVRDWYEPYYANDTNNPIGPFNGVYKVYRGGKWNDLAEDIRSTNRNDYFFTPSRADSDLGFRCASTP